MKASKASAVLRFSVVFLWCVSAYAEQLLDQYLYQDPQTATEATAVIRLPNADEATKHSFSAFAANWLTQRVSIVALDEPNATPVPWTASNVHAMPGRYTVTVSCRQRSALGIPDLLWKEVSQTLAVAAKKEYVVRCDGRTLALARLEVQVLSPDATPEEMAQEAQASELAMAEWKAAVLQKMLAAWKRPSDSTQPVHWEIRGTFDAEGHLRNLGWVAPAGSRPLNRSILNAFKSATPYPPPPNPQEAIKGVIFTFSDAPAAE